MSKKSPKLSIKKLESLLSNLDGFEDPKVSLEQYITPPHIAALIFNEIHCNQDDIEGRHVADLGCGPGMLTIGSLICGAQMVHGFDIDNEALNCALENVHEVFGDEDDDTVVGAYQAHGNFNLVQSDVASEDYHEFWKPWSKKFDTVLMNPPFGTKNNKGLDMAFLERAIDLSNSRVYSLHKTSTRKYIMEKMQQMNLKAKPIAQLRYNLDSSYKFHRKKTVDIDVDLWQIKCS